MVCSLSFYQTNGDSFSISLQQIIKDDYIFDSASTCSDIGVMNESYEASAVVRREFPGIKKDVFENYCKGIIDGKSMIYSDRKDLELPLIV